MSDSFGHLRESSHESQQHRMAGCNLVAAINLWNTVYLARAVEILRLAGTDPLEDSAIRYRERIEGLSDDDPRRKRLLGGLAPAACRRAARLPILVMAADGSGGWQGNGLVRGQIRTLYYDVLRGFRIL